MATTTVSNIRPSIEVLKTLKKVLTPRSLKVLLGAALMTFVIVAGVGLMWSVETRLTEWGTPTGGMELELALRDALVVALIALTAPLFARAGAVAVIEAERPGASVKVSTKTALWIGVVQAAIPVGLLMVSTVLSKLVFGETTGLLAYAAISVAWAISVVQQVRLTPAIAYAALGSSTPMKESRRMVRGRFFGTAWRLVIVSLAIAVLFIPLLFIPGTLIHAELLYIPATWGTYALVSGAVSAMICLDIDGKMVYQRTKLR